MLKVLNRVDVRRPENIPARGEHGVILCGNHISAVDPFVIAVSAMPFFSPVWWRAPAKEELFRIPLLRSVLRSWGAFPVRRGRRDLEAIELMTRISSQSVIVIFPEGRRSPDGRLQPGKAGVGKIIYDARPAKVIPVMIEGSDRMLPRGRVLPRMNQTVTITYGPALDFSEYFDQENSLETSQKIVNRIMEEIKKLE